MLLTEKIHLEEASQIFSENFYGNSFGNIFFGIVDDKLQAIGALKCYYGYWYLRAGFVKPEFRGNGLQYKLILERLDYLKDKTMWANCKIEVNNSHSIDNFVKAGFIYVRKEKLQDGKNVNVYRKDLS
jgi:ribosomal protein S18 acetylase RimI-like enzyme